MFKYLFFFLFLIQGFTFSATAKRLDSLLLVLDKTITEKNYYAEKRKRQIDSLRTQLNEMSVYGEQRYQIYQRLYEAYRPYNMSLALSIAEKQTSIAEELQNRQLYNSAVMNTAEILGNLGMYKESLDMIDKIDRKQFQDQQWSFYYHLHHSLYLLMSENAVTQKEKNQYRQYISQYKDSILNVLEINTLGYKFVKAGKLIEQRKSDEALLLMKQCDKEYGNNIAQAGIISYILSEIYAQKEDSEKEKEYLAMSSIVDLRKGVKEYIALRKLAVMLYRSGDINRAYNYIRCAMEDAAFCGARFRVLEISEALPIISAAYDQKMQQEKEKMLKALIVISILSLVLVLSILFVVRQMRTLSSAKKVMQSMYQDIKAMNKNLYELNIKLSESDRVKEEYIGSIFNLCSTYINKIEAYRIHLNKKLMTNQIEELKKITSTSIVSEELKEFFAYFDITFLHIFPNFIYQFNKLLIEGEQITPKAGDLMTPELRIYALIRLGITDNNKIAGFLHYSPQTVYNYKQKVKNKLAVSKDEFSDIVRQIGG